MLPESSDGFVSQEITGVAFASHYLEEGKEGNKFVRVLCTNHRFECKPNDVLQM